MLNGKTLDAKKIAKRMKEVDGDARELAARLNRSVTYARNVLGGWLPGREVDARVVVTILSAYLKTTPDKIMSEVETKTA